MTPRCFLAVEGPDPELEDPLPTDETGPPAGGEIFSNIKAGMVHPIIVELRHSWHSPDRVKRTVL